MHILFAEDYGRMMEYIRAHGNFEKSCRGIYILEGHQIAIATCFEKLKGLCGIDKFYWFNKKQINPRTIEKINIILLRCPCEQIEIEY